MPRLQASELPDEAKQQILEKIREQVGTQEYDRLVAEHGENGLIDILMAQVHGQQQAKQAQKAKRSRALGVAVFVVLLLVAGLLLQNETGRIICGFLSLLFFFASFISDVRDWFADPFRPSR